MQGDPARPVRSDNVRVACYTQCMLDENAFRRRADAALESLKKSLIQVEEEAGFEVEDQNGVLTIAFDSPPGKFVITPNAPARQIWISALSTSFKLDWPESGGNFLLPKTGEMLPDLVARLIGERLGSSSFQLC